MIRRSLVAARRARRFRSPERRRRSTAADHSATSPGTRDADRRRIGQRSSCQTVPIGCGPTGGWADNGRGVAFSGPIFVGLAVTSHDATRTASATFETLSCRSRRHRTTRRRLRFLRRVRWSRPHGLPMAGGDERLFDRENRQQRPMIGGHYPVRVSHVEHLRRDELQRRRALRVVDVIEARFPRVAMRVVRYAIAVPSLCACAQESM